jgi:hypothetical protein
VTRTAIRLPRALAAAAVAGAAATALALPATGVGGVAAIQDDVLTTAPLTDIPTRLQLVQATKAKVVRIDVLWSEVAKTQPIDPQNPADPAYDWTRLDQIFIGLDALDVTPIVSVYSTPEWAVAGVNTKFPSAYNPNAPKPGAFGNFMGALATRYNGFYPNPVLGSVPATLPRVRHFELWNEPNLKNFFRLRNKTSLPHYIKLVKAAYPKIKRANGSAIVIAGVGGPRSTTGNGNLGARKWLQGLVRSRSTKFDAYSQHIYPSVGPLASTRAFPAWNSLPEIFETLDEKRPGMKLYITEAGYTTGSTAFRTVRGVSPAVQSRFLKQLFGLPDVRSPRVAAIVWFNLQDNTNWPGGLLKASGVRKPAYASFQAVARRAIPATLRSALRN